MKGMLENIQSSENLRKACLYIEEKILQKKPSTPTEEIEEFVGTCEAMKEIFSLIRKVAATDLPVLILGESGTGKELTARAIHERSARSEKPLISLNCAAIPESLMESELFGYEKGAFTGAHQSRRGKIEQASGGTLFLDEIGELPLNLQPKLLRFLEDQMVDRLGSGKSIQVDVRIITATNRDLEKDVAEGLFRADLYHRLRVFPILLPPLRERGQDKVILAQFFMKKVKSERDWKCKGFSKEALDAIQIYSWPGNVREMINKIRRAIVIQDEWVTPADLELEALQTATSLENESRKQNLEIKSKKENLKKSLVQTALKENRFNATRAAKSLGISRTYLYVLCRKFNISTSGSRVNSTLKSGK
jgi:transcriptional regulator with GAF, ATPase, and Fis domain